MLQQMILKYKKHIKLYKVGFRKFDYRFLLIILYLKSSEKYKIYEF